jgi:MFS family permease
MTDNSHHLQKRSPMRKNGVKREDARSVDSRSNNERNLDSFLEDAYQQTRIGLRQWKYWCILLSLGVANSSDASEILCLSYILSDKDFKEQILQGQSGGVLAAAVFFGMLIGGLFIGTLGDWFGRKPMLLIGLGCNVVAGLLSALAPNVVVLSLLRCVAGVGIGATVPPLFTLATELAPPSQRGLCVTICASFWMVGSIYVALAAMFLLEYAGLSWRVFAIACAIPSAVGALLVHSLVPESPRFLALGLRHPEALHVTNSLAQEMNYRGPLLSLEEMEKSFPRSQHQHQRPNLAITRHTLLAVIWTALAEFLISAKKLYQPQMRRTTWPLQMVWFSLSFGSYGLMTWINTLFVEVHLQNVYFNALLFAVSNLPGNIFTAIWMDRVGRSSMLVGSVLAAAASLLAFAWCANILNASGIILSACSFQCFTIAAWNVIDTLSSELFPTAVRSTGMGVCAASGRIGAMIAQFVNGALVGNPVRLLLVASGTLMLGALTPCLLPNGDITGQPVQDEVDTSLSSSEEAHYFLPQPSSNDESPSYQDLKTDTADLV